MDGDNLALWVIIGALAVRAVVELALCAIEAPGIFAAIRRAKRAEDE